jgi:chromosome segregation ATPase
MSSAKRKLVLKKLNSHNTIWHPESTLVFKSQKERLVIGRYVNDQLIPLDDDALDLCDEWKFNPDESLLETGNEEDEESVEEGDSKVESVDEEDEEEGESKVESSESVEEGESKVESVDEESKEDDVEESNEKVENVDDSVDRELGTNDDVLSLASELSAKLNEGFCMVKDRLDKSDKENKGLRSKLVDTESRLVETEDKLSKLQGEYDVIKKKFDTMKSLFS